MKGLPYSNPSSPDKPGDRVSDDPPYAHTSIDLAGPPIVYQCEGDGKEPKAYSYMFVYMCKLYTLN